MPPLKVFATPSTAGFSEKALQKTGSTPRRKASAIKTKIEAILMVLDFLIISGVGSAETRDVRLSSDDLSGSYVFRSCNLSETSWWGPPMAFS